MAFPSDSALMNGLSIHTAQWMARLLFLLKGSICPKEIGIIPYETSF